MITAIGEIRLSAQQLEVMNRCAAILHPKFKRLLNPNIVDASVRLSIHVANGAVSHYREGDGEPAYAQGFPSVWDEADPAVMETLTACLRTLRGRIESRIGHGWHGVISLLVAISGGHATISSEVDGVHKTG